MEPSKQWLHVSQVCEKEFKLFHGENRIKKDINVVKDIAMNVSLKCSDFPIEVITGYIKMRTIIRMKDLNINLCATKLKKRISVNNSEDRKRLKKVKKVAT